MGSRRTHPNRCFSGLVGNKLLPLPLGSEAYIRDTDMEMKEASWSPGLGAPVQSRPHKCARNFIQILLGRSPQASFLLADTPPPGRILRLFLLKIPSGMFPPCHLLTVNDRGLRRDETCKGRRRLCDLGQVTELLSALVSSSFHFYCEDTEIMHVKCFP